VQTRFDALAPAGFRYRNDFLQPEQERALVEEIRRLPLAPFKFHGWYGRRRVVSYGWRYDYDEGAVERAPELPAFLHDVRRRAAAFADLSEDDLVQSTVTEYSPGTPIGWHRDKKAFDDVIGVSLLSACQFRLRRRSASRWERYTLTLEPRSIYLMRGPVRTEWEHSIPEVEALRYSITFRSLR
jgi:alkylated DNA repair dioxygenase AlkB